MTWFALVLCAVAACDHSPSNPDAGPPSAEASSTRPGTVTDLKVIGSVSSAIALSFTQVSDGTGAPASYDVRFMKGSIAGKWSSAQSVSNGSCATPLKGLAVGQPLGCTIGGLDAGSSYQVQLIAFRGKINGGAVYGSLSNVASGQTTAATPPATAANECDNRKPEWIWCDDFDRNRLSSYFEYNDVGGRFAPSSGNGLNGSTSMRAHFGVGTVNAGDLKVAFGRTPTSYMRAVDAGSANYREVYWRFYLKNQAGGGGGYKLTRGIVFASSSWAEAAIGHVWTTDPDHSVLTLDPASGTTTAGTLTTTAYNDFSHLRWLGIQHGITKLFAGDKNGAWHCIEAHMRLNDGGQSNGVLDLWVDGVLDSRAPNLNLLGSYTAYGINTILLENYWNNGAPADQVRDFDNFVVSPGRVGCGGTTTSVYPPVQLAADSVQLPDGTVGQPYSVSASVTGGDGSYSWTLKSGALPPGVSLDPTTGSLSGTPSAAGSYRFTGRVTSAGTEDTIVAKLTIRSAVTTTTTTTTTVTTTAADFPHRPSGHSTILWYNGNCIPGQGCGEVGSWHIDHGASNLAVVNQAGAPVSSMDRGSMVLQTRYPVGHEPGTGPVAVEAWDSRVTNTHYREIYVSYWIRFDPPNHEAYSGVNKFGFIGYGSGTGRDVSNDGVLDLRPAIQGAGVGQLVTQMDMYFEQQNHVDRNIKTCPTWTPGCVAKGIWAKTTVGPWHRWELVLRLNTLGQANGILKWWQDGTLVADYSDVVYITPGNTNGFYSYNWNPTWGGGTVHATKKQEDLVFLDQIYISGIPR